MKLAHVLFAGGMLWSSSFAAISSSVAAETYAEGNYLYTCTNSERQYCGN